MPPKAPKCRVAGCQARLNAAAKATCKQCKNDFCKDHSFPSDHDCLRLSAGLSRSASAPALDKAAPAAAAAAVPGVAVLVSKTASKSPLGAAAAAPAAQPSAAASLLKQLQAAEPAALLDALLKTSPSAAADLQPLLIRAFGEEMSELRMLAAEKALLVSRSLAAERAPELLNVCLAYLELEAARSMANSRSASVPSLAAAAAASQSVTGESRQDRAKLGVLALLAELAKILDIKARTALATHLLASLPSQSSRVQSAIGVALPSMVQPLSQDELRHFVAQLLARVEEGRGIAHGLSGLLAASGSHALESWGVLPSLQALVTDKAASIASREAALLTFELLCMSLGTSFEPYMVHLMPTFLACYSDIQATIRDAAEAAAVAVVSQLAPQGVKLVMTPILEAMSDRAWKKKESSLQLLSILARRTPRQVGRCLPAAIPKVVECLQETHPKVAAAAAATISDVASVATQPEIQKNLSALIDALSKPDQKTAACLEKARADSRQDVNIPDVALQLMETTFVNSMDSAALAIVVPVVTRGLRERSAELKKIAAMTAGNIFALVNEPRDMAPFVPLILPEVTKALEHSHPDVRKAAERAKVKLLHGARMEEGAAPPAVADKALALHVKAALSALPGIVSHYVAEVTTELLEDKEVTTAEELAALLTPITRFFVEQSDLERLTVSVVALHEERELAAAGKDIHAGKDLIVNIANIILAFAGRILLNKTPFFLERGHCYGLVGQNGVGKTTLLTRIAAGDINNFPKEVSTYYIQHEILAEAGTSVTMFMHGQVPEGCTTAEIMAALYEVGFTDERASAAVSELSGGWRMKLAIARSMLWNADLLLLDEPTNHLDVSSVDWLSSYIRNLKCTVCLVSHDYDFLDSARLLHAASTAPAHFRAQVLTDVIHICDSKLVYYPGSFSDFQKIRPEIVAGLPSPANAVQKAKAELAPPTAEAGVDSPAAAAAVTAAAPPETAIKTIAPLNFPDPGVLDGIKSRVKTVMKLSNVSFKYETAATPILTDASVRLTLGSRVALVGLNGAGKTTLLKLLVGDLQPIDGVGEVWKHHNLRVAYIAQHSMHHLEDHVESSPLAYIQDRFYLGRDKELAKLATLALDDGERELMTQRGEIEAVIGRAERGSKLWYEVQKVGRKKDDTIWEPLEFLVKMSPYVMKLVKNYDEKMKAMASGVDIRPLTAEEVKRHLGDFGINEDLAVGKIRRMSGGQKSRLVLAAAMWSKPHIIALDEPTNYLDNTTLAALTKALQIFKGGVVTISHNEAFVEQLCNERWRVGGGVVAIELTGNKLEKQLMKEALAKESALRREEAKASEEK